MNIIFNLRLRKKLLKSSLYVGIVIIIILLLRIANLYVQKEVSNSIQSETSSVPNQTLKLAKVKEIKPSAKTITNKEGNILPPRHGGKNIKRILTWNDFFSMKHYNVGEGRDPFKRLGCKVLNCELWHRLDSENTLPHDEYDALVFHGIDTGNSLINDLPLVRSPYQRYIFFVSESPAMRQNIYDLKNFFNWTATYRRDSDLFQPYVVFKSKASGKLVQEWMTPTFEHMSHIPESISNKTKLVAWFSTNPYTQSKRHTFAEWLSENIPLDIYGDNKNLKCPRNASKACDEMLEKNYKFYLAFENSLCDDYLTEKILRPFLYNTVPVVYGGADYKFFLPPHSYIDLRDFKSPRLLANYLHYLNKNPKEYLKYFWWKPYYYAETPTSFWCNLCEKLHKADEPNKVYPDIESWWIYPHVCRSVGEHFKTQNK